MVREQVHLTAEVHHQMLAHAVAGVPYEVCGLFSGLPNGYQSGLLVDRFYPMRNIAESSTLYLIDGQEMLEVEQRVDSEGSTILGVMHSHTHTPAYPSPTDVADASRFDPFGEWVFVIVSLEHADMSLRAYRILGAEISEMSVGIASS